MHEYEDFEQKSLVDQLAILESLLAIEEWIVEFNIEILGNIEAAVLSWPNNCSELESDLQVKMFELGEEFLYGLYEEDDPWGTAWESFVNSVAASSQKQEVLEKIVEDFDYVSVIIHLIGNPNIPSDLLEVWHNHEHQGIRLKIAARPDVGPLVLAKLAKDTDFEVRTAAYWNPSATEEIKASAILMGINE